jgi:cobalt-zinc-cadmium resistance protein CzcA
LIERLVESALRDRVLVVAAWVVIAAAGLYCMSVLTIDAVPDITNVQVQVLTTAPAFGPLDVERQITVPIEAAMSGLPDLVELRSVSRSGLSAVTVVFDEGVNLYFARQLVSERLAAAREAIAPGSGEPEMGPPSTGLGEIYQFEIQGGGYTPMELRSILEGYVAIQLRTVPGVAEINTFGGELKTYEVAVDPDRLAAYSLSLDELFGAVERNNASAGGASIERGRQQILVRGEGLVTSLDDLKRIVVRAERDRAPVTLGQAADVRLAPHVRAGAATRDGKGEIVSAVVLMLWGRNSRTVVDALKAKIDAISGSLPPGTTIRPYYDRTDLIRRTIRTVIHNLTAGGLLVIAVLLLTLGSLRAGLLVALAIPLSMLCAFVGMFAAGISGNLMSLGAIDFGLIVDGSVVMVEAMARRGAGEAGSRRLRAMQEAALEMARPVAFAVGIIIVVYLPILTLRGIEGKMFRPMAFTVVFALAGSLLLALTLVPLLASVLLQRRLPAREPFLIRGFHWAYGPALARAASRPVLVVAGAGILVVAGAALAPFLGAEFIPRLDEGAIAIEVMRLPGVSLPGALRDAAAIERTLLEFPEVKEVVCLTGHGEIATDPMGVESSDALVFLRPRAEWNTGRSKEALVAGMEERLQKTIPGLAFSFSQPIEMRMSELIAGARADVVIKLYGEDLEVLADKASEIARVVSNVRGAEDVRAEQVAGLPVLRVRVRRDAIARYGIDVSKVLAAVEAVGGKTVGYVAEGNLRYKIQVRLAEGHRTGPEEIGRFLIAAPDGRRVPLAQLADMTIEEGPGQIGRENIQRRITVQANVRGRDLASFVGETARAVAASVSLPPGYHIEWAGQFRNLEEATLRLAIAVPTALLLIFILLYATFGSGRLAALIYVNIPLAATGGVFALGLRGMPFSISAGVGFIALFGVAVLNGVVLVTQIRRLRSEGVPAARAAMEAAETRMRPVLMTALVASLGFVPMAISTGAGAEVQRPLATVVIGGLVTSTLLTLFVLPTIYRWFDTEHRIDPASSEATIS